jgi:hypothetical protein
MNLVISELYVVIPAKEAVRKSLGQANSIGVGEGANPSRPLSGNLLI